MKIQNITMVVRGTKGEVMKAVFDIEGNCLSGSADIKDVIAQAHDEHLDAKAAKAAEGADGEGDTDGADAGGGTDAPADAGADIDAPADIDATNDAAVG